MSKKEAETICNSANRPRRMEPGTHYRMFASRVRMSFAARQIRS
jgi:hypothetical protein